MTKVPLSIMIGKTFSDVYRSEFEDSDSISFVSEDGTYKYVLYHEQICCEHVFIEDICGDLSDLVNTPIKLAVELDSSHECVEDEEYNYAMSHTYTFYNFRTIKGDVSIRFYGSSNGNYSEKATLVITKHHI